MFLHFFLFFLTSLSLTYFMKWTNFYILKLLQPPVNFNNLSVYIKIKETKITPSVINYYLTSLFPNVMSFSWFTSVVGMLSSTLNRNGDNIHLYFSLDLKWNASHVSPWHTHVYIDTQNFYQRILSVFQYFQYWTTINIVLSQSV